MNPSRASSTGTERRKELHQFALSQQFQRQRGLRRKGKTWATQLSCSSGGMLRSHLSSIHARLAFEFKCAREALLANVRWQEASGGICRRANGYGQGECRPSRSSRSKGTEEKAGPTKCSSQSAGTTIGMGLGDTSAMLFHSDRLQEQDGTLFPKRDQADPNHQRSGRQT